MGELLARTGVAALTWREGVMIGVALLLLWLAIGKKFEPLLLVPIGFGALITNLPLNGLMLPPHGEEIGGLFHYLSQGVKLEIFPPLVFLGLGALTDFGPLLANPKTFLLGGAAQLGVFGTFLAAGWLGFTPREAASIGIIGGADGPTSIYLTIKLAPHLLGAVAVSAYSYMALVPLIQPPIMRALTTREERRIRMAADFDVPRWLRISFPIVTTVVCALLVPAATALVGLLMFGNLLRECGVTERLNRSAQNELINLVTIVLGLSVGVTMDGDTFLHVATLKILLLGCVAFAIATAGGVLLGKVMARLPGSPINPLIGAAGVSAVPMAARVAHQVGQEEDPDNYLLMHAMGPNVAGVIGTAVAAGSLLALLRLRRRRARRGRTLRPRLAARSRVTASGRRPRSSRGGCGSSGPRPRPRADAGGPASRPRPRRARGRSSASSRRPRRGAGTGGRRAPPPGRLGGAPSRRRGRPRLAGRRGPGRRALRRARA